MDFLDVEAPSSINQYASALGDFNESVQELLFSGRLRGIEVKGKKGRHKI